MAAHRPAGRDLEQVGLLLLADRADLPRTARVEHTAGRWIGGARDLAREADALPRRAFERGDGGQQRLRVRMVRPAEHVLGRADLHQPAEVQDGDPVGQVADDAEIVRDEEVRRAFVDLEIGEQVENRRLDGHVERAGRLVAHDEARAAGERARDRDTLLEATRQLRGARRQVALGEPDVAGEPLEPFVCRAAGEPGELAERPAQDAPHGMAAVESLAGALEHDLQGTDVLRPTARETWREQAAIESDRAGARLDEPEECARERRLAAAGLAHEAEGLPRSDRRRDVVESVNLTAVLAEHLADSVESEERLAGRRRPGADRRSLRPRHRSARARGSSSDSFRRPRRRSARAPAPGTRARRGRTCPRRRIPIPASRVAAGTRESCRAGRASFRRPPRGTQRSRPTVYGCLGSCSTRSVSPSSTMRPA